MSVYRCVGMQCNDGHCKEDFEYQGWQAVVSRVVADARKAGWLVSRDMMTTLCPEHRKDRGNR